MATNAKKPNVPKNKPLPGAKAKKPPQGKVTSAVAKLGAKGHGQSKVLLDGLSTLDKIHAAKAKLNDEQKSTLAMLRQHGFPSRDVNEVARDRRLDPGELAIKLENRAIVREAAGMQLTFEDRMAMGEQPTEAEIEATQKANRADRPDPAEVARKRASDSTIDPAEIAPDLATSSAREAAAVH